MLMLLRESERYSPRRAAARGYTILRASTTGLRQVGRCSQNSWNDRHADMAYVEGYAPEVLRPFV